MDDPPEVNDCDPDPSKVTVCEVVVRAPALTVRFPLTVRPESNVQVPDPVNDRLL